MNRPAGDNNGRRRVRRTRSRGKSIFFISALLIVLAAVMILYWNGEFSPPKADPLPENTPYTQPLQSKEPENEEPGQVEDPAQIDTSWQLILVNRQNPIPSDYEVELTQLSNGKQVATKIYPALQEMFDDARGQGIYPIVVSGYRTAEDQQRIMDEKIAACKADGYSSSEAKKEAENWVAIPGTSEHQLGIAVDINADGVNSAGYEVYDWLDENAHRYGFIRRYPPDKTEITGVSNEPWHYRYVGLEAAQDIYRQGVCLEEYLGED